MSAAVVDEERLVEALRFAAALRGAGTQEQAILWCLQHGYMYEETVGEETVTWVTASGRAYAEKMLDESRPIGATRWLLPTRGAGLGIWALGRIMRR
jgi:hypothetical protein